MSTTDNKLKRGREEDAPGAPLSPGSPASVVIVDEETERRPEPKYRVIGAARGLRVRV